MVIDRLKWPIRSFQRMFVRTSQIDIVWQIVFVRLIDLCRGECGSILYENIKLSCNYCYLLYGGTLLAHLENCNTFY